MDWWDVLKAPIYYREEAQPFPRSQRERVVSQTAGEQPQEYFGQPPRNPNTTLSDSFDPNRDGYGFTELNLPGAFPPFRNRNPMGPTNTRDTFFEAQDESSRGVLRLVSDNPPVYELPMYGVLDTARGQGMGREGIEEMRRDLEQRHGEPVQIIPQGMTMEALPFWDKMLEERVVDNPNRVRKEAKSPKALRHKREYETRYESSPERKRYRRDLERERRKRGVAGKGGKDMSHTKRGTIVPEDPHTNRARSHPSVGSTLKAIPEKFSDLVEVHHPIYDAPLEYDMEGQPKERLREPLEFGDKCRYCEEGRQLITAEGAIGCSDEECYANTPEALQSSYGHSGNIHNPLPAARLNEVGGREGLVDHYTAGSVQADPTVRIDMTPRGPEALQPRQRPIVAHGRNVPNYDTSGYFTTGDPMDLSFRMLKDETRQTKLPQELTAGAHEAPIFARQREAMERKRKQDEAAQRQRLTDQARAAGKSIPLHAFAAQTPAPEDSQRPE